MRCCLHPKNKLCDSAGEQNFASSVPRTNINMFKTKKMKFVDKFTKKEICSTLYYNFLDLETTQASKLCANTKVTKDTE